MGAPHKYNILESKPVRWHDGSVSDIGANSLLETDPSNIVLLGGISYIASYSQVNVLLNTTGRSLGIGTTIDDTPVSNQH